MGYRIKEREKPKPRRTIQNTATPSTIYIQNGTTTNYAIPCWYLLVDFPRPAHHHCRPHHDHVGWPSPNHPDHICQAWDFAHSCCSHDAHKHHCDHCEHFIDLGRLIPIHLLSEDEGYTSISIAMDEKPDGLTALGFIDEKDDWIVRIVVTAVVRDAIKEKVEVPYTVFANGTVRGVKACDVVARGKIVILPGPIGE